MVLIISIGSVKSWQMREGLDGSFSSNSISKGSSLLTSSVIFNDASLRRKKVYHPRALFSMSNKTQNLELYHSPRVEVRRRSRRPGICKWRLVNKNQFYEDRCLYGLTGGFGPSHSTVSTVSPKFATVKSLIETIWSSHQAREVSRIVFLL